MSHLDLHELLSAYLDDEVTPEERARVEAWLASSDEARRELDELRSLSCLLRESLVADAPADLAAEILRRTAEDPPAVPVSHVPADRHASAPHRPHDEVRGWIVTGVSLLITAAALLLMLRGVSPVTPVGSGGSAAEALEKAGRTEPVETASRDAEDRPGIGFDATGRAADAGGATGGGPEAPSHDDLARQELVDAKAALEGGKQWSGNRDRNVAPRPRALAEASPAPAAPPSAPRPEGTAGGFGGAGSADKNAMALQKNVLALQPEADRDRAGSLGVVELAEGLQAGDVLPYLDGAAVVELTVVDVRRSYGELQLLLAKQGIERAPAGIGAGFAAELNGAPAVEGRGELRLGSASPAGPTPGAVAPSAAPVPGPAAPVVSSDAQAAARGRQHATKIAEQAKSKDSAGPQLVAVLVQAPEAALAGILEQLEQDELVADLRLLDGTFVAVPERREQVLALKEIVEEAKSQRTADAALRTEYEAAGTVGPKGTRSKSMEFRVADVPASAPVRRGNPAGEGGAALKREADSAAKPGGPAESRSGPQAARSLVRPDAAAPGSPQAAAAENLARNQFGEWLQRRNAVQNARPAQQTTNAGDERVAAKGTRPETEAASATATPVAPANPSRAGGNAPIPAKPDLQQNAVGGRSAPASNAFQMPLNGPEPSLAANRRPADEPYVQSRVVEKTDGLRSAPATRKSDPAADARGEAGADRQNRGQNLPADDPTLVRMIFVLRTSPETDRPEPAQAVPTEAPAAKSAPAPNSARP